MQIGKDIKELIKCSHEILNQKAKVALKSLTHLERDFKSAAQGHNNHYDVKGSSSCPECKTEGQPAH